MCFLLIGIRLFIGSNLQIWLVTNAAHDDVLMLQFSNLSEHFLNWNIFSLTKVMSYPLFLSFVNFTKLPYTFWLSILWIIGAIFVGYGIYKFITKNKIVLLLAFAFILFLPIGFDIAVGMRIYRHAILAPVTIITVSALFIFLNYTLKHNNLKVTLIWAIITGFSFSFNYYIKEDGIMFLPLLIITIFGVLFFNIINQYKKGWNVVKLLKIIIICLLPLILFIGTTIAYEQVNNHYYGINEIDTRNNGEFGKFWKLLLKIDDENKTTDMWVPPSTIEKAFDTSPTLKNNSIILDSWMHTGWAAGDVYAHPLHGDIVAWSLRDTMSEVGLFQNEQMANSFFKQVNMELESAFDNGSLKKSDDFFISDSLNGKNPIEIKELNERFIVGLEVGMFYDYVRAVQDPVDNGVTISTQTTHNEVSSFAESRLNEKIATNNELSTNQKFAINFASLEIQFYQIISYIIVSLSVIGFIILGYNQIMGRFKDKQLNLLLFFEIMVIGTFIVQVFAIAWFTSWVAQPAIDRMEYYSGGFQALFAIFEVLTICSGFKLLKKWRKSKKNY